MLKEYYNQLTEQLHHNSIHVNCSIYYRSHNVAKCQIYSQKHKIVALWLRGRTFLNLKRHGCRGSLIVQDLFLSLLENL